MNNKTTYVLFGGFAVLLVALLVFVAMLPEGGEPDERGGRKVFPTVHEKTKQLNSSDVTKVVIQRKAEGDEIVLEREDKNWKIKKPRQMAADSQAVDRLIGNLLDADFDEERTVKSTKDHNLESPSRVITMHAKVGDEERKLSLSIGDVEVASDGFAYAVSSDNHGSPGAIRKRHIEAALGGLNNLRAHELAGSDTSDVTYLKVTDAKKGGAEFNKVDERWQYVQPEYGAAALDSTWLQNVTGLKVAEATAESNDFVKDDVTDLKSLKELEGVPPDEKLTIEVGRGDPKKPTKTTIVVLTGKKLDGDKADKDPKGKLDRMMKGDRGEKYFAYVEGEGGKKDVVKLSVSSVEPFAKLAADPGSLRSKALLAMGAGATPDAVDVQNNLRADGLLEFRNVGGQWVMYRGGAAVPTKSQEVQTLIGTLSNRDAVVSFADAKDRKELGLESPILVVKVWADSLESKEDEKDDKKEKKDDKKARPAFKKDAKPVAELRFGKGKGALVAVERVWGANTTIVMVPDLLMHQLNRDPLSFYDLRLPQVFSEEDATKLEYTGADGKPVELTRENDKAPWTIVKPESQKGRKANPEAVDAILSALNPPNPRSIAVEKAGAADLEKYGLKQPKSRIAVTVTADKKETRYEFDFGSDAGNRGVYAKVPGKEAVYVVDSAVLAATAREVRDTTIFDFLPSQVTTLKVTGWHKFAGTAITYTLERSGPKWVLKEDKDRAVNVERVNELISALASLKAEKFVAAGKGFEAKEGSLKLEVTLADNQTFDLTIGAEEGNDVYATSGQLKGEAALVRKAPFAELKEKPAPLFR